MKMFYGVVIGLTLAIPARAQVYRPGQVLSVQSTLPASCTPPDLLLRTATTIALYVCTATDVWSPLITSAASGVPSGAIVFIDTGTCPTGFAEATAADGRMILATLAAHGDVGGTGGSDTITPTGTVAWPAGVPTFTGAQGTTSTPSGVAQKIGTSTASAAISSHTHTLTPSGTVAWPAGVPTFTGAQFDNRSAWVKWIACKKT